MKKKMLTLALALCLMVTAAVPAFAQSSFTDVAEGSWYYENVTRMTDMKALTGYPDGTFRPEGSITNGEFVTMLMRTLTGTESYPTESGHWAAGALSAAYESRVCTDTDLTEEQLDTPITRSMAAKYTANAIKYILKEDKADTKGISSLIVDYADVANSGCADAIIDMYAMGIIQGDDLGRYNPSSNIKRCEAATIVLRAYDKAVRVLPFGIAASIESIHADRGVFFLDCVGSKYDVERLTVTAATANGVTLNMQCLNTELSYRDMIEASSKIRKEYEGRSVPDAVLKFDWNAADIKKLSTQTQQEQPVIDFVFTLEVKLTDGTVLPFTYSASYAIMEYGGLL